MSKPPTVHKGNPPTTAKPPTPQAPRVAPKLPKR
jgi:hypothetical protein